MDVYLLGPVEARLDERPIALGAPKQRAVLAMLALAVDHIVSTGALAEGLWGAQPPSSAAKMVQKYVSRLRRVLAGADAEIVTRGQGYGLRLGDGEVDAVRFERLIAADRAREALALWRGDPLCDLADEPFAAAEIRRLQELRLRAGELAVEADLAAGRHAAVLPELEALLVAQPLRERLYAQRMLALYRCGRQSDALAAYRDARDVLVERIGVEPGPELRRLHEAILRQDASLEPPAGDPELDTPTPLIGREHELAWLRQRWRRAQGGDGGLVLVAGAPGSGKTRLVAEFAAEARRERGAVVVATSAGDDAAAAAVASRPTLLVLDSVSAADLARLGDLRTASVLIVATAASANGLAGADVLTLAPLDTDAVRAVARHYADADVPVERLLRASEGNPRRLHAAAADWARGRAARRVDVAATRIAAERPVLRAAEDALVTRVVELQATRERGVRENDGVCPFKGLAFFHVEDSEFFCGRERLVAEMVARATGAPLLGIVGASGSGKSSALRAGLLAALTAGVLPGSERWPQALLRPGAHPLQAFEQATAGAEARVVAIDQFEELFTACRDENERAAFADALVHCTRDARRRVLVLIALRADYYARCAAYPDLAQLLAANHVLAGPMRRDELRRAIERPALRGGLRVEPDLVDALVAGVEGQPGALPLLSTSLLELWERRDGPMLRLADYEHAGGVEGAVSRLAERAYERLETEQREAARRVLLRLAAEGDDGAIVRRRVALAELGAAEVVAVLADERLVTIADGDIEVAHEALLREWPRLRDWLQEDAQARRMHRHLSGAAREWLDTGRDASELYRGARLSAALDWSTRHEPDLSAREREFLAASRSEAAGENARQRRVNRRLRALLGGVAALLVLAVVVGAVAIEQRGAARHAALVADAQRVGAQALTRDHLDEALLLARAGVRLDDSTATRSQLLNVLMRQPQALGTLTSDGTAIHHAALSPSGRLIALAGGSDTVTILDTASRMVVGRPYRLGGGGVWDLKFSPDGRTLAVTGFDIDKHGSGGVVDLVDARTHARRLRIVLPRFPEPAAWLGVNVLFGPDGRELIVQQVHEPLSADGPPSVLRRFDAATGTAEGPPVRVGRAATISMWSTGDRRTLFITSRKDRETYMLSADRLQVLRRWPVGDFAGTVNADGSAFVLGSQHGAVRLLDLRTGRVRPFSGSHGASVLRMRFTDDGRTLVTTGADGKVIVWDVARGEIRREMSGHASGLVWGLDIAADGRTAYTGGEDERAFVWDLVGDRSLVRPFTVDRAFTPDDGDVLPRGLALSPDGRTLAVGHSDGVIDLLDTRTLRARASFRALRGFVAAIAFSPDGRALAASGQFGQLTLWDARTLRALGELKGQHTTSQALAFSPDGASLAGAEVDTTDFVGGSVHVWELHRRAAARLQIPLITTALAFSRDGRLLAMNAEGSAAEVRDARSGRLVTRLRSTENGRSVTFSPNGRLLATGHFDGTVQLWSTATWKPVGKPIEGHDGKRVLWLHFTRDGSMLATAGLDGTIQLADVAAQTPIGGPLNVEPDSYLAAALSPDTRQLFTVSGNRAAIRWAIAPETWKQHACRVAGRELTRDEWHDAMPGRPYRPVCRVQMTRG